MELNSYEVHVPTEQYGFILGKLTGGAEEAVALYKEIQATWNKEGLTEKEMDAFLDAQLSGDGIKDGAETYERMNVQQQKEVQRVKRALARLKAKNK